ncbi:hypothetical protein EMA8858_04082 [Emticicia aquatica]|uniref:Peptidase M23 n=1 Tax=Emticicia aquatica TaxID=1681835 RepID=A0ABN8EXV7_9BACT|nr:hypothetical protein [Emticicia aquatica]CAH0997947.1 hypothetical protein EMA8858_04082 [Emticicia aquatica]
MKKSILALGIFTFITSTIILSCNSNTPAEKVENAQTEVADANKDLEKANEEYMADMASYKKESADKIATNEASIKDFNERISTEKKTAKAEYQKKINELEEKNTDLKKKLDDYKENGKENWAKFKTEFNHDMDELGKAFKDLTVKNVK